jgi:hypothetical protein
LLTLPCVDQEESDRTRRVDCEAGDAGIDTAIAFFSAMGIPGMSSQRADTLDDGGQSAQHLADVIFERWLAQRGARSARRPTAKWKAAGERHRRDADA